MTFSNDLVTFVNADFSGASQLAIDAIKYRAGANMTGAAYMSKIFNDETAAAKESFKQNQIETWYRDLAAATVAASPSVQANVKTEINAARALVGLSPIP